MSETQKVEHVDTKYEKWIDPGDIITLKIKTRLVYDVVAGKMEGTEVIVYWTETGQLENLNIDTVANVEQQLINSITGFLNEKGSGILETLNQIFSEFDDYDFESVREIIRSNIKQIKPELEVEMA